jgi:hypothetical protein
LLLSRTSLTCLFGGIEFLENDMSLLTCQEFRRTKGNISSMREHAELLTSVRNDISEYKVLNCPIKSFCYLNALLMKLSALFLVF